MSSFQGIEFHYIQRCPNFGGGGGGGGWNRGVPLYIEMSSFQGIGITTICSCISDGWNRYSTVSPSLEVEVTQLIHK